MKLLEALLSLLRRIFSRDDDDDHTPPDAQPESPANLGNYLAWGKKVDAAFRKRVFQISNELGINPDWLMAVMAFESAETFSPSIKNAAGSGATGLIQFMPKTAVGLGTTTAKLAQMTALEQLEYVLSYFWPYRGRLHTLADVYMAVLWPAGIGKPSDWVLWDSQSKPTTYRQNAGLDANKDGIITKNEAAAKVQAKLSRGNTDAFRWVA